MKIFTWHIHGTYLYYLSKGNYQIYIPVREPRGPGYHGRGETFPFGANVIEVPVAEVPDLDFDCLLFQTETNYRVDQYEILTPEQRAKPRLYLEHDAPRGHAAESRHPVDEPGLPIVHVTHYNRLMWDNGDSPTLVIEHGVEDAGYRYTGEILKGLVVLNDLPSRGRTLGYDVFLELRKHVPLDLVGMRSGEHGLGEVLHPQLPEFMRRYRFYLHPVRHTSLGLSVCEAMTLGMPVAALATTELPTILQDGVSGYLDTSLSRLTEKMRRLLDDAVLATRLGREGRATALRKFSLSRFTGEWEALFRRTVEGRARGPFETPLLPNEILSEATP